MFKLKHDIRINLKNEKEVFRLIRLLVFTFILSAALLGISDYIWNMTLYKIARMVVPWIIAIPAIINCVERKKTLKDVLGKKIITKILLGFLLGFVFALIMKTGMFLFRPDEYMLVPYECKTLIYNFFYYYFVVAMTEELIYRVAILESLEAVIPNKWVAYVIADLLFAGSHLFQASLFTAAFNVVAGAIYIALYKWKKGGYVFTTVMHGTYDFIYIYLAVILHLIQK